MRVISGKFKGKRLFAPEGNNVRPTTDRIKESIFNILSSRNALEGVRVLDLFCGSGALGIEALSRGAASAIFVDKDSASVRLTKKNLEFVGAVDYEVFNTDFAVAIPRLAKKSLDLIFLDPPYNFDRISDLLAKIAQSDILRKNGIIILEHSAQKDLPKIPLGFIIDTRRMGSTNISLLTNSNTEEAINNEQQSD